MTRYTPEQMEQAWRDLVHETTGFGEIPAMLRQAAADARRVCETCRFAREFTSTFRHCDNVALMGTHLVPLTVDGEPFGCVAWKAKA